MNISTSTDANIEEFRKLELAGIWSKVILVGATCFVGKPTDTLNIPLVAVGMVSTAEFARRTGVPTASVGRYARVYKTASTKDKFGTDGAPLVPQYLRPNGLGDRTVKQIIAAVEKSIGDKAAQTAKYTEILQSLVPVKSEALVLAEAEDKRLKKDEKEKEENARNKTGDAVARVGDAVAMFEGETGVCQIDDLQELLNARKSIVADHEKMLALLDARIAELRVDIDPAINEEIENTEIGGATSTIEA